MQPYFFPHIGYFSLIKHTERFILLDTVQYIYHGWIARNRILKPGEGWQYFIVPLRAHSRGTIINDILINDDYNWKDKIVAQMQHYKKRAPFFDNVINLVDCIFSGSYESISQLNLAALEMVLGYLQIDRKPEVFSDMGISIERPENPDEWALNICCSLGGVTEYWNPPGGKVFFDSSKYERAGIKLLFHEVEQIQYSQRRESFEQGLSILDVLFFNSIDETHKLLDCFRLSQS
jgi:hypothetical protein